MYAVLILANEVILGDLPLFAISLLVALTSTFAVTDV